MSLSFNCRVLLWAETAGRLLPFRSAAAWDPAVRAGRPDDIPSAADADADAAAAGFSHRASDDFRVAAALEAVQAPAPFKFAAASGVRRSRC